MEIGHKIKNMREKLRISQEEMAEKMGISQQAYGKIESGDTKLTIDRLILISQVLHIEVVDLLQEEKNIFNNFDEVGNNIHNVYHTFDHERTLYEKIIAEKDKRIKSLENLLDSKK